MDIRKLAGAPGIRSVALAGVVLTFGVATGAGASAAVAHAEQRASDAVLALRTATVRSALDNTFQRYADTVHDLVAAAATQPVRTLSPTVAELVGERLPGAHEVLVVGPDNTVLAEHAVDGSTPSPQRTLTPEPELDRAMRLARVGGRLVATASHVLGIDRQLNPARRQSAFELAAPVHAGADFRGWVVVSVRAQDLLESSLRGAGVTGVATALTETGADGVSHDIAHWAQGGTATGTSTSTVDMPLADHAWQIRVGPIGAPDGPVLPDRAVILLAAVLASLLAAGSVIALAISRNRARRSWHGLRGDAQRALRAEAVLREREAELVGFTAMAGDNLQTPLSNIVGFTELLIDEAGPQLDETSRGFLDRIRSSTRRVLGLVEELVAYTAAADAALCLESVDTARLVAAVVAERTAGLTGERPSIDIGDLPVVTADAVLLRQVFDQLIGNALRFVRHGGIARITIGARRTPEGWWRIEVADRGIGVPDDHRGRIFAPFHRTPSAEGFPGCGLGLAICRRVVDLHGGRISVQPNPGGGSVFAFTVAGTGVGHPAGGQSQIAAGHP